MNWNPFSHLVETERYASGRLIRSSLWQRMKDAFWTFTGYLAVSHFSAGLLDYPFLQLPAFFAMLFFVSLESLNTYWRDYTSKAVKGMPLTEYLFFAVGNTVHLLISAALTLPLGLVALAAQAIKFIAAAVLTAAALVVALPVHLATWSARSEAEQAVADLRVMPDTVVAAPNQNGQRSWNHNFGMEMSFADFATNNGLSTGDIESMIIKPLSWVNGSTDLAIHRDENSHPIAVIAVNNPDNKVGVSALLRTNLFQATSNLESKGYLDTIEQAAGLTLSS